MAERDALNLARAVGGLLAIITLLTLIIAQFFHPELSLRQDSVILLVGMISALLGVDMFLKGGSISITTEQEDRESRK